MDMLSYAFTKKFRHHVHSHVKWKSIIRSTLLIYFTVNTDEHV